MRQILLMLLALSLGGPAMAAPGRDSQNDSATRGLFVALRVCSACHAVATLGAGPDNEAPPFAMIRMRHNPGSLRRRLGEISTSGHGDMPPIPLTPKQIEDVANYIETVGSSPAARPPWQPAAATVPPPTPAVQRRLQ